MRFLDLCGKWILRGAGLNEATAAEVPGCVHLDLIRAGVIPDPFYGDNEAKVAWVHEIDWEYSRTFDVDERLLDCDAVFLECDGLDTLAEITLNGALVAKTDNMNIGYRFDVTGRLAPGSNELRVLFKSPVNHVKPLIEQDSLQFPYGSLPGSPYVRKAPYQWGWDWAPQFPTMGIWKDIRLVGHNIARIDDLWIRQRHENDRVTLDVEIALERLAADDFSVRLQLQRPNRQGAMLEAEPKGNSASLSLQIDEPQLWWPNGYGAQPLYLIAVDLVSRGDILHSASHRFGLRTIELLQEEDEHGRSFTFIVNGVRIFAKGADWVPADSFPTRVGHDEYSHLVASAGKAGMNMFRVWGGGLYESDEFYNLCDEHGILVWQDCQFACALFPTDDAYLDNVRREIEYNVKRLRSRTCLALWSGNNEIEWQISQCDYGEKKDLRRKQYLKIFHELMPPIFATLDPDRAYWPSSPSSGKDLEPFEDPNSENRGNSHCWDVWHGRQPFTFYRSKFFRFVSEFGFQSLPVFETVRSFASDEHLNLTSYVMETHQKCAAGMSTMLDYLARTFRLPKNFEMLCYASQLLSAEAIRTGVEHWRRNRDRCSGTLYWQLNDCWPAVSWASIDYFGRWKALHYFAKRFYQKVLVSVEEQRAQAKIHVTNDTLEPLSVELKWSLEKLDGTAIRSGTACVEAPAERNTLIADLDFTSELAGDIVRQAVLVHEAFVNGNRIALGLTPFVPSKHLELPEAALEITTGSDDQGAFLDVTGDRTARFVCLSVPGKDVIFSDNYFDLPAGRTVRVQVESDVGQSALDAVRAHSLRDSY